MEANRGGHFFVAKSIKSCSGCHAYYHIDDGKLEHRRKSSYSLDIIKWEGMLQIIVS